jgi:hypothetical protein
MAKKPRTIKNASVTLKANENDKGKRSIEINIRHDSMTPSQAKTIHSRLLEMIVWCEKLA